MSRSSSPISSDKPLGGRYKVISQLGVGGFGRTFLAEDLHLPGHPRCVVKQLKPQIRSDDTLQMARRCFNTEAQVLYQLGIHDQIPRLLAHFEDHQEFYLAQEFIEGQPLTKELTEGKPWSENQVVYFLKDVLQVLTFVHQRQVIHRDLKPSNLIRRISDRRVVLIDFGAVKQVGIQNTDLEEGMTNLTISIGTQGYMANEQLAGKPRFSSDIYAVGILGIQALTGIHPRHLGEDLKGEIAWHHHVPDLNPALAQVLDRMVRYDFRERYPTAIEAHAALEPIPLAVTDPLLLFPPPSHSHSVTEAGTTVAPIDSSFNSSRSSAADPPPPSPLPLVDFSEADYTVAAEDSTPTALWENPGAGGASGTGAKQSSAQSSAQSRTQSRTSAGRSTGMPPETSEGGADAADFAGQSSGNGTGGSSTGLTQAVGRPRPDRQEPSDLPAANKFRRWQRPRTWLTIALALGSVVLIVKSVQFQMQQVDPNAVNNPLITIDPTPPPSDPKQRAAFFVNRAGQLQQAGQPEDALKLYNESLSLNPDSAEAYAGRCEALNQLKRPEEAIVACNDALAYRPNYPEALWSKGNALLLQNRTYEALKIYEEVTFSKPDFASGWVRRGVALQQLGRSAEALTALDEGIRLQRSSAEAWRTKGAALLTLQRYEEAIVALDKALQLQPNDAEVQKMRRQAKAKVGG